MKRIIGLLFIALSLSCCSKSETDKEGGGNYVLSITPQNLKFPANGDSQNVIVASNAVNGRYPEATVGAPPPSRQVETEPT